MTDTTATEPTTTAEVPDPSSEPAPAPEPAPEPDTGDGGGGEDAVSAAKTLLANWPTKGTDEPQPWDHGELGIKPGINAPELEPGEPDTVSPVLPRVGLPMLTEGSQGDEVRTLGLALGRLGYANSVSEGRNFFNVYDITLTAAVDGFRRDFGVEEDPSQFPRDARNNARSHAGPWTQEAILRAAERLDEQR
jgi:hypothetical protein